MNKKFPVPVIMYHSVGISDKKWIWSDLTCPFQIFENQLKWMEKFNYHTIDLNDLYEYIFLNKNIPEKSVVLTFDDGYVDNWVFAFPLLNKYDMKGTIFVNPDFVDKRDIKRKRIDECETKDEIDNLQRTGYLSWEEMIEMENSGLIDIQNHAMTHTWYPISDTIMDFRHPGDTYNWMTWNAHSGKKPELQTDKAELINYGEPVYEHEKSLSSPRYYPDKNLKEYLKAHVKISGDMAFFKDENWRETLFSQVNKFKNRNSISDEYETDEEYGKRVKQELLDTKEILEKKLNKKIEFLCWPGGGATKVGTEIAEEIGIIMSTAAEDVPELKKTLKNCPPQKENRIKRIGSSICWNGQIGHNSTIQYQSGLLVIVSLMTFQRKFFAQYWGRIILKIIRSQYLHQTK